MNEKKPVVNLEHEANILPERNSAISIDSAQSLVSHQGQEFQPQVFDFEIPRNNQGAINWKSLRQNPEHLKAFIEAEVYKARLEGVSITNRPLAQSGRSWLVSAVHRYYPGGFNGLQTNIGDKSIEESRREVENTREIKPHNYWTDLAIIENEAKKALESGISLTTSSLRKEHKSKLVTAIFRHYPGGMPAIRAKYKVPEERKARGYWKDIETIEREAMGAAGAGIRLSSTALLKTGKKALSEAISEEYPGGYAALRKKLGLPEHLKKPFGFWKDIDTIESEARKTINGGVSLTIADLRRANLEQMYYAIRTYYPGGFIALRKKLGLETSDHISSDEADEFMRSLDIE